jgi:hypothetical protein
MIRLVTVASVFAAEGRKSATVIERSDASELDYWAARLNVPKGDLTDAIDKVGPTLAAVRRQLSR